MRPPVLLLGLPLAGCLLLVGCSADPPPSVGAEPGLRVPAGAQQASVVRGVDGDTVVLRGRGSGPLPAEPTRVRVLPRVS